VTEETKELSLEERLDNRLHRMAVKAVIAFAFFGFTMAATVAYVFVTADHNRVSLCALRADAQERIDQSEDFIKENPNGIPGISVEQLRRSTNNSVRTRNALANLKCDNL
jgi:hypothetical protein